MILEKFTNSKDQTLRHVDTETLLENGEDETLVNAAIFAQAKPEALATVKAKHANALLVLTGDTTPEERDTWPVKVLYAEKLAAGTLTEPERAMITSALVEGETVESYLAVISAKTAGFAQLSFFAEGFKRKTNAAIEAATTAEQISTVLDAAAAEMAAAVTAFQAQLSA